eukprot:1137799-Pelagomonas_calceolata.AAC.3
MQTRGPMPHLQPGLHGWLCPVDACGGSSPQIPQKTEATARRGHVNWRGKDRMFPRVQGSRATPAGIKLQAHSKVGGIAKNLYDQVRVRMITRKMAAKPECRKEPPSNLPFGHAPDYISKSQA